MNTVQLTGTCHRKAEWSNNKKAKEKWIRWKPLIIHIESSFSSCPHCIKDGVVRIDFESRIHSSLIRTKGLTMLATWKKGIWINHSLTSFGSVAKRWKKMYFLHWNVDVGSNWIVPSYILPQHLKTQDYYEEWNNPRVDNFGPYSLALA